MPGSKFAYLKGKSMDDLHRELDTAIDEIAQDCFDSEKLQAILDAMDEIEPKKNDVDATESLKEFYEKYGVRLGLTGCPEREN